MTGHSGMISILKGGTGEKGEEGVGKRKGVSSEEETTHESEVYMCV